MHAFAAESAERVMAVSHVCDVRPVIPVSLFSFVFIGVNAITTQTEQFSGTGWMSLWSRCWEHLRISDLIKATFIRNIKLLTVQLSSNRGGTLSKLVEYVEIFYLLLVCLASPSFYSLAG